MFRGRRNLRRQRILSRLIGQPVHPLFAEANRCLEMGDYSGAAERYEQLAMAARPRNAGHLFVEAGRARLLAGQVPAAMLLFRRGLDVLAAHGRWIAVHRQGERVIRLLRDHKQNPQADEIDAWLRGQPAAAQAPAVSAPAPEHPPRLPLKCPACGGTLDPRDVEWVDAQTVECDYCGSLVRAEED